MPLHPQLVPIIELLNESMQGLTSVSAADIPALRVAPLAPPGGDQTVVGSVENRRIPGPAGELAIRVYTPAGSGPFALVVFYHGGGFVLCDLDSHDELCRVLCRDTPAVVVSVDYRLAPEAKYPAAADDCYAALKWSVANAASLDADASRVAVAGDSAGGNLAASTALRARDLGGPALRHQALIYPVTDCAFDTASYRDNAEGYFLRADAMRWFWSHYLGNAEQAREPYASPLRANGFAGLPSATVITAQYDPLRDEGEQYAERMRAAGVAVSLTRSEGMIHGFVSLGIGLDDARAAQQQLTTELRVALA